MNVSSYKLCSHFSQGSFLSQPADPQATKLQEFSVIPVQGVRTRSQLLCSGVSPAHTAHVVTRNVEMILLQWGLLKTLVP